MAPRAVILFLIKIFPVFGGAIILWHHVGVSHIYHRIIAAPLDLIYPLLKDPNRQPTVDTLESMAKELDWSVPLIFEAWYGWATAYRAMDPQEALIHAQFESQE